MQFRAFTQISLEAEEQPLDPAAITRLGEIDVPTLVIAGALDVPDFLTITDRLAAEITGAQKVVIAQAAHLPSMEQPAQFNQVVLISWANAGRQRLTHPHGDERLI